MIKKVSLTLIIILTSNTQAKEIFCGHKPQDLDRIIRIEQSLIDDTQNLINDLNIDERELQKELKDHGIEEVGIASGVFASSFS